MLPAFVAIFALMFVATPYVAAEDDRSLAQHHGEKMYKKHMPIHVEDFEGSIKITEDSDRQELKDQVTVSLSEAAEGLDVYKASLGAVINEDDEKFLVWVLANFEKDAESGIVTATIYIVDAGDSSNTTQITREIERSEEGRNHSPRSLEDKLERLEEKFSEPTGDEEIDELGSQLVEKIGEIKEAHEEGDSDRVQELRQEIKDLLQQLRELKSS